MALYLSAGIELEGLLVFRKDLLQQILPKNRSVWTGGLKDNGQPLSTDSHVSGWALQSEPDERVKAGQYLNEEPQKMVMFLLNEPIPNSNQPLATTRIVTLNGVRTPVTRPIPHPDPTERFLTRSGWIIKRDYSIKPLTKAEKRYRKLHPGQFDTIDIELVSGVYTLVQSLVRDVRDMVARITTNRSFLYHTRACGMHIHVGTPNDARLPLQTLRVLGFICLIFEHEISRLYQAHRAEKSTRHWIGSNIYRHRSRFTHFNNRDYQYASDRTTIIARSRYVSVAYLRREILANPSTGDPAYQTLKRTISRSKKYIYNFQNIDGLNRNVVGTRPPTVEFRQPEATFDPAAIGHLVNFYTSLVTLAFNISRGTGTVLPQITRWDSRIKLDDLLRWLRLPQATYLYFVDRINPARYASTPPNWNTYWEHCNPDGTRPDDDDLSLDDTDDEDEEGSQAGDENIAHESSSDEEDDGALSGDEDIARESSDEDVDMEDAWDDSDDDAQVGPIILSF